MRFERKIPFKYVDFCLPFWLNLYSIVAYPLCSGHNYRVSQMQ